VTRLVVLCPHFAPDTAPTGTVMTRIVDELVELGVEVHVVTSLPWYAAHAVEPEWRGRTVRTDTVAWGSITRISPFAGADKRNLVRRAIGFVAYSALAGVQGLRTGGALTRVDAVFAMSPPLTLGLTGWLVARLRRGRLIFNIQDVFPDAAVATGAITNPLVIRLARALERLSYRAADVVTVLSDDLAANVRAKLGPDRHGAVTVIPNFVDTDHVRPQDRMTPLRRELGLDDRSVVMYAGNLGFSQSVDLLVEVARALPEVQVVINGDGAARASLDEPARELPNLVLNGYVAEDRLAELLATGDIHVVPLRAGLGSVSVPSKAYSIMAAARPIVASIDPGTAVPRVLAEADAGVSVPPDDAPSLIAAIRHLLEHPDLGSEMGARGRRWVERHASPAAVGAAYGRLVAGT
jgi:colanic acid biosynthesis glycosyl transferase WcaI